MGRDDFHKMIVAATLTALFTIQLSARPATKQNRAWLRNLESSAFICLNGETDKVSCQSHRLKNGLWRIRRMAGLKCRFENVRRGGYLAVDPESGSVIIESEADANCNWSLINHQASGNYLIKSLTPGETEGWFLHQNGDAVDLVKDRKKRSCLWKIDDYQKRVVLWNQLSENFGVKDFDLVLYVGNRQVWDVKKQTIRWDPGSKSFRTVVKVPDIKFDRFRIIVNKSYNGDMGLSEAQVYEEFQNIALGCAARVDEKSARKGGGDKYAPDKVTDDVIDAYKRRKKNGYWRTGAATGWIEIDLTKSSVEASRAAAQLKPKPKETTKATDTEAPVNWSLTPISSAE